MRVSAFDLGVKGAVFRADNDDRCIFPLSCEMWSLKGLDEERYFDYDAIARAEVKWADAVGYELVQFNRGKSLIEGFRAILVTECKRNDIFCAGINVATLKKFAIKGRWSDKERKKKGKENISAKRKMELALSMDYPEFLEVIAGQYPKGNRDDLIDAAWVAIWLLETAEESNV